MDLVERDGSISQRHPWEIVRGKFFQQLLTRLVTTDDPIRILDVGSGDAWFAAQLVRTVPAGSSITCWDANYSASDLSQGNALEDLILTADQPIGKYSGILMLDVIEHVENDVEFISKVVSSNLEPGGWILVSVPAYQSLFTSHDSLLRHFRRYSPWDCEDILYESGLQVDVEGGLFHSLLGVRAIQAMVETMHRSGRVKNGVGGWDARPWLSRIFTKALELESQVSLALGTKTEIAMPGLSYWAFCHRSNTT